MTQQLQRVVAHSKQELQNRDPMEMRGTLLELYFFGEFSGYGGYGFNRL